VNKNSNNPSQEQINNLLDYYQKGRFDYAEKLATSITNEFPNHPFGWKVLGALFGQSGRNLEALNAIQRVVKLSPRDFQAFYNLGISFQSVNKLDKALICFDKAIELKPDYVEAYFNKGNTLKDLNKFNEAEICYKKAIKLKSNYPEAHNNLGVMFNKLGKFYEAEISFKKAIELKPDFLEVYNNLGILLKYLNRFDEAEVIFKKVLLIKPDYELAHNNLGNTYQEMGKFNEAEVSFNNAIKAKPNYLKAHFNLGNIYKEMGRLEEAEKSYKYVISLKPDFMNVYTNLGYMLKEQGRMDEAVTNFQKSYAIRTNTPQIKDDKLAPATTGLFFELTNKCNFHCVFCPSDSQKRDIGSMDIDLIKRLYQEAANKKIATEVNLHLMGEPTLHPRLIEILKYGASKNIKTDLVTNGSTLVAKVVPQILDSLYGTITASHMTPTKETYHFRGKVGLSWERYISNLRLLVREYLKRLAYGKEIKNNITIRVMATQNTASNVSITENENEARLILKEWNDYVSHVEQELRMKTYKRKNHNADDLLQKNNNASISYPLQNGLKLTFWRADTFANTRVGEEFDLEIRNETSYCPHPFTDVGVLWNGDVTLCCLDHDGLLKIGNIKESSIETLIHNDAAKKLRASMLGRYPLPSVCQTCQAKPVKR
jgi:tetratricopeptide (TPR) repeat protein